MKDHFANQVNLEASGVSELTAESALEINGGQTEGNNVEDVGIGYSVGYGVGVAAEGIEDAAQAVAGVAEAAYDYAASYF